MNARLPAVLCAVSVAGSLAGGCGGGSEATPPPPAPPKKVATVSPPRAIVAPIAQGPVSRARAIAFARSVNLTASDLADAHASSGREPQRPERELGRCGFASERKVASVSSPSLKRGSALEAEQIGSSVTVYASEAAAGRELAALQSASGRACAARLLKQRFLGRTLSNGARVTKVDLSALPVPAPSAPSARSSAGIRLAMWVAPAGQEVSVPAYGDFFGFTRGPALISYGVISVVQPEPATIEQQIGSRLSSRAASYSL